LIAHGSSLAAQLDTLDAALGSPQLKSLGSLALPLLKLGVTFSTMDSTMLGRTLEWDPIWRRLDFTPRAGAPSNAVRLVLYKNDATGSPVVPKEEVGYADLVPMNLHTGGKPDSVSLRIAVFNNATPNPGSVADILAWRRPSDVSCGQCASFSASAGPVTIGNRTIHLDVPFQIPVDGDGQYSATASGGGLNFNHTATLPGPTSTAATANLGFRFGSDSIIATSGALHPNSGRLIGQLNVAINGTPFATVTRAANGGGATASRPGGQAIGGTDLRVLEGLFAVPADIAYYIEWPMFVVFYCGC